MTYTREDLINDVTKEAQALKREATKEELAKLDMRLLRPVDKRYCIYGLMTGTCISERAAVLIDKCALRHFEFLPDYVEQAGGFIMQKSDDFLDARVNLLESFTYSAIEVYIQLPDAKNANLIAYLKGETETLDL